MRLFIGRFFQHGTACHTEAASLILGLYPWEQGSRDVKSNTVYSACKGVSHGRNVVQSVNVFKVCRFNDPTSQFLNQPSPRAGLTL
jgi:uncharacterized protein YcgI (DUF1989 family)